MVVAVADHEPPPVLVDLISELVDVGGDLGVQRRGQHLSCTIANDLVEQRSRRTRRSVCVGLRSVMNYLAWAYLPNQRGNAGPDQSYWTFRSFPGRCAHLRRLAENHPQTSDSANCQAAAGSGAVQGCPKALIGSNVWRVCRQ